MSDLPPDIANPDAPRTSAIDSAHPAYHLSGMGASLKDAEVRLIERALLSHNGNLSKAAISLGISRPTLYRKIESYGIKLT
jgi:DNA-binding NtrC family response regulator